MVEVEYERGAVRAVNRRRGGRDDGGGGVQANTAVPARVCGCGCGYRLTTWTGRRWKSRQHSSGYELSRLSASIRISGVWCLGCRCRPVAKGRLKMRVECKTGPGVGAGMKDSGRPPPPARSLEWHSTPPPPKTTPGAHLCGSDTYLPARHCPRGQAVCKLQRLNCSILHPYRLDGVKQTLQTDSLFLFQSGHIRPAVVSSSSDARSTEQAPNGPRRINGATGPLFQEPDETLSLSGPSPSPPPRSPGPGFPGQQQVSLFFFSSHPSPGSLLFSSCLEKLVVGPDPTGFQAGIDRLLLPRAWTFPPCHALPPHAEREGI